MSRRNLKFAPSLTDAAFTGIRPLSLFSGQWADMPLDDFLQKAAAMGYDTVELACWGGHFDVVKASDPHTGAEYCEGTRALLRKHNLKCFAISAHLVGQAVCDLIDDRHKAILPDHVWGGFVGGPEGVRQRAAEELKLTAVAAKNLGVKVVNGFTGSSIWHLLYSFPPVSQQLIIEGYADFAARFKPILDVFTENGVFYAVEVHPTEIAFDIETAHRMLEAVDHHPALGFNYDPSHFLYQDVDYIKFIYTFAERIFNVHMKDVASGVGDGTVGVFGGHTEFHTAPRGWDFRSVGRGDVDFEKIIRALNAIKYNGPLSVEWEDGGMDRVFGATESAAFVRKLMFPVSGIVFDAQFAEK